MKKAQLAPLWCSGYCEQLVVTEAIKKYGQMCVRAHFRGQVCLSIETFQFENADGIMINLVVNVMQPEDAVSLWFRVSCTM